MKVEVNEVVQPVGMFDTIIQFKGMDQDTHDAVTFGVDHRPANGLIAEMRLASLNNDPPIVAYVEDWQILKVVCDHLAIHSKAAVHPKLRGRDVPTRIPVFTRDQRARLASKDPGCSHERTLRITGD